MTQGSGGEVGQEGGHVEVAVQQNLEEGGVAGPLPLYRLGVIRRQLGQHHVQRLENNNQK